MSRDDKNPTNSNSNVFIRFKQRVDSNIATGLDALFTPRTPSTNTTSLSPPPKTNPSSTATDNMADSNKDTGAAAMDIYDVASTSYNPLSLRYLRQPVPNDLPYHLDSRVFTFQDAFEDLLAVSHGKPLPDIQTRYDQSRLLRQMYPNGEPTFLWLRRLESQGLANRPRGFHIFTPAIQTPEWDRFERDVEKSAKEFSEGFLKDLKENPSVRDLLEAAGLEFKTHDERKTVDDTHKKSDSDDKKAQNRPPPDNFDDLYSAIKSKYAEGQKAWDAFKNIMSVDVPARAKDFEQDIRRRAEAFEKDINRRAEEYQRLDQERRAAKKNSDVDEKPTETREEYVDLYGYKHTTVRRKTFDEHGNEIGSSVEVTIRPAEENKGGSEESDGYNRELDNKNTASESENGSKNKRGWLWKRGD